MIEELPDRLRKAMFFDSPQAIAVITRNLEIKQVNKRFVDLFGWSSMEMEEKALLDLAETQADKKAIDVKVILMIDTYQEYDRMELVCRTKLGDLRKVLIEFFSVFDQNRGGMVDYLLVYPKDLGAFEGEETVTGQMRRLWGYVVILTPLLWVADFAELGRLIFSWLPGIGG